MSTSEPVIVIDNLYKSYGAVQAVKGISISVERAAGSETLGNISKHSRAKRR